MLSQLPPEVLERIAGVATVGSRARLAAVCRPLKHSVYAYEARTPAARLAALRGSFEVFWDLFAFMEGSRNRLDAARTYGVYRGDTGVAFHTTNVGWDAEHWICGMTMTGPTEEHVAIEWDGEIDCPATVTVRVDNTTFVKHTGFLRLSNDGMFESMSHATIAAAEYLRTWYPGGGGLVEITTESFTVDLAEDDSSGFDNHWKRTLAAMLPDLLASGLFYTV